MGDSTVGHASKKDLAGIGGWLILVAIGQIIGPLISLAQLANHLGGPTSSVAWKMFPLMMWGELALWGAFCLYALWCSSNFFNKRKIFPALYIWELWLVLALLIVDTVWVVHTSTVPLGAVIDAQSGRFIFGFVTAVIWTWYTLKSKRVKDTFVT